ncbi:hypothetical protein J6590_074561 [Homalodisca vitripennis]|nr:hypothetical protein J6590_074561 [Homalodisca vitripennis]
MEGGYLPSTCRRSGGPDNFDNRACCHLDKTAASFLSDFIKHHESVVAVVAAFFETPSYAFEHGSSLCL